MTSYLQLSVCVNKEKATLRSVRQCWACPLPSCPTAKGPGGRSALRDWVQTFLMLCFCHKKKIKHEAVPPAFCRCCQRAGMVLYINTIKPNIVISILQPQPLAAPWLTDFRFARLRWISNLFPKDPVWLIQTLWTRRCWFRWEVTELFRGLHVCCQTQLTLHKQQEQL